MRLAACSDSALFPVLVLRGDEPLAHLAYVKQRCFWVVWAEGRGIIARLTDADGELRRRVGDIPCELKVPPGVSNEDFEFSERCGLTFTALTRLVCRPIFFAPERRVATRFPAEIRRRGTGMLVGHLCTDGGDEVRVCARNGNVLLSVENADLVTFFRCLLCTNDNLQENEFAPGPRPSQLPHPGGKIRAEEFSAAETARLVASQVPSEIARSLDSHSSGHVSLEAARDLFRACSLYSGCVPDEMAGALAFVMIRGHPRARGEAARLFQRHFFLANLEGFEGYRVAIIRTETQLLLESNISLYHIQRANPSPLLHEEEDRDALMLELSLMLSVIPPGRLDRARPECV